MKPITLPKTSAKKPVNHTAQLSQGADGKPVLLITSGKKPTGYRLEEFPTDWHGRAFRLTKLFGGTDKDEPVYSCFVAGTSHNYDQCGCRGHAVHGHCKHLDAMHELIAGGQLPAPAAVSARDEAPSAPAAVSETDEAEITEPVVSGPDIPVCTTCGDSGAIASDDPATWSEPMPCPICRSRDYLRHIESRPPQRPEVGDRVLVDNPNSDTPEWVPGTIAQIVPGYRFIAQIAVVHTDNGPEVYWDLTRFRRSTDVQATDKSPVWIADVLTCGPG